MAGDTKPQAIVVLSNGRQGALRDDALRRWLSRGALSATDGVHEILTDVLEMLGHDAVVDGLAALRFWGQTGERSGAWMVAADPVHMEARMDHLCLRAFHGTDVPVSQLGPLFDYLQAKFGSDDYAFARIGEHTYVRGDEPLACATVSSLQVDGLPPDEFMPQGEGTGTYHRFLGELQMALHEHEVNEIREQDGAAPVNSLWLWGGGAAPEAVTRPIWPLFSNDALFRGYWLSCTGIVEPWQDTIDDCIEFAEKGFVLVAEADQLDGERTLGVLRQLRHALQAGRIANLSLMFRDGLRVQLQRADLLKVWRRVSPLL